MYGHVMIHRIADSADPGSCRGHRHIETQPHRPTSGRIIPIRDDDPLPQSASTVADAKMTIEQEAYAVTEGSWNWCSLRLTEIKILAHGIPRLTNTANVLSGQHPGPVSGHVSVDRR